MAVPRVSPLLLLSARLRRGDGSAVLWPRRGLRGGVGIRLGRVQLGPRRRGHRYRPQLFSQHQHRPITVQIGNRKPQPQRPKRPRVVAARPRAPQRGELSRPEYGAEVRRRLDGRRRPRTRFLPRAGGCRTAGPRPWGPGSGPHSAIAVLGWTGPAPWKSLREQAAGPGSLHVSGAESRWISRPFPPILGQPRRSV